MTHTNPDDRGEVVLYRTEDGRTALDVRLAGETVWPTQAQMVDLLGRERSIITKHIRNIFSQGELKQKGNVQKMHIRVTIEKDELAVFYEARARRA